jgi:glutathione S-transferase
MPVAQIGDQSIGQSAAINYYFAAENGLLGSNNLEAAQIISIYEHLKELNTAYRAIVPYGTEPTEEMNNKWFDTGATDVSGPAVGADRSSRFLKWWMGRIESTLGNNGFAVGNKLSLADVLLYNTFAEHLRPEECKEDTPNWRKHPMGNSERVAAALAAHPKIKASCDAVAAHPNVQKWLSIRGVQGF